MILFLVYSKNKENFHIRARVKAFLKSKFMPKKNKNFVFVLYFIFYLLNSIKMKMQTKQKKRTKLYFELKLQFSNKDFFKCCVN
jgi:hypothetical protein